MAKPRQTLFARGVARGRRTTAGAIQGLVVSNLRQKMNEAAQVNEQVAREAGELILKKALPLTPIKTGALRESGRVEVGESRAGNTTVEVTFGGGSVDYAVFVHEDMPRGVEKTYTAAGTGPKYLQRGAAEALNEVERLIKQRLSTVARKGSGGGGRRSR